MYPWGDHHIYGAGWFFMIVMAIFWVFLIIGIVFITWWLINRYRPEQSKTEADKPLEILKIRYARGEISREEYLRMKDELE